MLKELMSFHPIFLVMLTAGCAILADFAWQAFKLFRGDFED